jgi:tetratricopeptide (TPR) repeat protein
MIFRPDKAIECFQRVLSLTRKIPDAFLELAVLYERRHQLDQAYALIEDCLRAAPDYLEAELFKARLLRRRRAQTESETLLRKLSLHPRAHPLLRAQAWAELAQTHDRRGEFDDAMSAMLKCKELLLPREQPALREADVVLRQLTQLADSLTAADFARWKAEARDLAPQRNAVLAGFPRSGTTLLEQILDSHPALISSDEREAFARDIFPALWMTPAHRFPTVEALNAAPLEKRAALRQRYRDYISAALNTPIGSRIHLDKNPTLTLVLPGFLRLFPDTHVIIALRDPRDVVLSCFFQYLPLNPNSVCFLTLERAAQRYATDMAVWRKLRDIIASPWIEIRYEDTVRQLEQEARRILAFLDLPWDPQVLHYRERLAHKTLSSPTYEAVREPVHSRAVGRWKNYAPFLEPCLPILQPSIDAFGYR